MKKRNVVPFVIALLAISALLAFTSPDQKRGPHSSSNFSVLATGDQGGMEERKNFLIENENELAYYWSLAYGEHAPPVPNVDFEEFQVLAVFEGLKPSGGHTIGIESVIDRGNFIREVTIRHTSPGASCATTSVITSPFEFVIVPTSEARITRIDKDETVECE